MDIRWTLVKLKPQKSDFRAPDGEIGFVKFDHDERPISNISYTRRSVLSDIQTPRSELKNEVIAELFNQLRGVWISDETRLSRV